ncbi:hypothetical protein F8M41_007519 [Gigaspora margarita]|uniref:Uncharacterized protein n=1 Tax=Gigaspora margarita TaxID=4874 RepID=A0A8H4AW56_GIGMA|nr:hypothetical protein F8M41_007519 [Gigaspora margarita]
MLQSKNKIFEVAIYEQTQEIVELEGLMTELCFKNSDLTDKLEEERKLNELNKEIIEVHNNEYIVYSRNMEEKDNEISRLILSKNEIVNENAWLKTENTRLKECIDNIQNVEVNDDKQDQ